MRPLLSFPLLIALFLIYSCSYIPHAKKDGRVYLNSGTQATLSTPMRVKLTPASEMRFRNIVRQHLDYSCGSAAIATLFNYYLGIKMSEKEVINRLFEVGNKEKIIRRKGFSLLDMKKLSEKMGFRAYGVKTNLQGLVKLGKPSIVTIVIGNYKHFVVFRGVYKGRVFIADPAFGQTVLDPEDFERMWYKNIALVVEPGDRKSENLLKVTDADLNTISGGTLRGEIIPPLLPVYRGSADF